MAKILMPQILIMVMKKGDNMQFIDVAKTRSKLAKPKVAPFMEKIECKK